MIFKKKLSGNLKQKLKLKLRWAAVMYHPIYAAWKLAERHSISLKPILYSTC